MLSTFSVSGRGVYIYMYRHRYPLRRATMRWICHFWLDWWFLFFYWVVWVLHYAVTVSVSSTVGECFCPWWRLSLHYAKAYCLDKTGFLFSAVWSLVLLESNLLHSFFSSNSFIDFHIGFFVWSWSFVHNEIQKSHLYAWISLS